MSSAGRQEGFSIRRASPVDSPAIVRLSRQLGYEQTEDEARRSLSQRGISVREVLVVELNGEIVGWIEIVQEDHLTSGRDALITGLVVDEAFRGRGIGAKLVEAAESWAVDLGLPAMRVRSRISRERAHRFYLNLGYEETKRQVAFQKDLAAGTRRGKTP